MATIMITIRLVLHRQLIMNTLPPEHATHYVSVATIVIESAALYSIFALGFIVTYTIKNPLSQVFMSLASACQVRVSFELFAITVLTRLQQIAGYLIIIRLAQERAWNANTLTKILASEPQLTTIQYNVLIDNP